MKFINKHTNNLNIIICFCLATVSIFIYYPIFEESVLYKQLDFQWSPAKLAFEGINHYEYMLDGKRERIIGSQFGEYLHGLYIILYPFTIMSWESAKIAWFILNFFLIIYIPFLICAKYNLGSSETLIIIFFFISANVTKAHMVIGQQTIFVLFFMCLPFVSSSRISIIFSGIAYFKYSISYVLFFYFIIKKNYKFLLYSLIIPILGWLIYSYITNTNIFASSLQPFQLAIHNHLMDSTGSTIMPDNIFIFSFFEIFNLKYKSLISIILSLFVNFYFVFKINKLKDDLQKLSCLSLSVLIFFPQYPHNYVLILPLLIFSIKNFDNMLCKIYFISSIYFLFFFRAVEIYIPTLIKDLILIDYTFLVSYINSIFLLIILSLNIFSKKR